MKITNFRLALGFPLTFPMIPSDFFFSCLTMERPEFIVLRGENGPIDAIRNQLVEKALIANCSHILMMDTDMVYHPKTITRLLSHKLPVVGGLTYRRYPPFDPLLLRGDPIKGYESIDTWKDGDLVEVDATGTGCIMFSMEVFRKMPSPWFYFRPNPNDTIGGVIGEDIGFAWDLKRAGYRIFVDTTIPSSHLTQLAVNDGTYRLYKAMKLRQRENAAKAALSNGKTGR